MTCALIALLVATLVAGCAGGGDSDSSAKAPMPAGTAGGQRTAAPGDADGPARSSGAGAAARPGAPAAGPAAVTPRDVVYNADLRVRSGNVDASVSQAKQLAAGAGGYVGDERTTSDPPGATLTLKVPSGRYAAVLEQLAARLGTKLSLSQRAEDVTQEVADVDSRVRSAEATLKRFRTFLDKAGSVDQVIEVEKEIAGRESELESLQARQKALQESTGYGTIRISLSTVVKAAPKKEETGGFTGALGDGWHAFTAFVGGLLVLLGWLLPFLVLLALFAAVGVPLQRARARRAPPAKPVTQRTGEPVGASSGPRRPAEGTPPGDQVPPL